MKSKLRNLALPSPKFAAAGATPTTYVQSEGPIVIVGANGSGKTRLGTWIELESEHKEQVRRISAQKSLEMPPDVTSMSVNRAQTALLYGHPDMPDTYDSQQRQNVLLSNRWGRNPSTFLLSDFDKLLSYLFSDANETNARYVAEVEREKERRIEPPETRLRATKRLWEQMLPHRTLEIGGDKVETRIASHPEAAAYSASEMSDGERVIFYLIGQALSTPEGGIIVIDEPELHLHKSIQARLWDAIEAERSDCLFVYLTHDLDFAASRITATTVWLESYDGETWDWHEVEAAEDVPDQLYLEILGGRKPVLFCEGDKGSLDYFLFQKAYPDFTVAPCGNAYGVIQATRAFATFEHLHNYAGRGIVDRDFRDAAEVEWLQSIGVAVLNYSEVENVLLSEKVLRAVADHLELADTFVELLEKAQGIVFCELSTDRERLVSSITASKIESHLKKFDAKARGTEGLGDALRNLSSSTDVEAYYNETAAEVERVIAEQDYAQALRLYNNKGLLSKIEPLFGFARKGMPELVKRLASAKESSAVLAALRKELPKVET